MENTTDVLMEMGGTDMVHPFLVNISRTELDDLRRSILATKWPDKETVTDRSQGPPLATMQADLKHH